MISKEKFYDRCKWIIDDITGCWNVISHAIKKNNGYVEMHVKGKVVRLHRLSYLVHKGEIEKGKYICHSCDNPSCVNPDYLFMSTPQGNMQDMINKGRFNFGNRNGKIFKLTHDQIREIKLSDLSSYKLSEIYDVSSVQIRRIRNGSRCSKIKVLALQGGMTRA